MSRTKGLDLRGVFSPITTPFEASEAIAWDRLNDNLRKWNATPLRGYLVQGSNGEYCYLKLHMGWNSEPECLSEGQVLSKIRLLQTYL
jgi:hypothetical protein